MITTNSILQELPALSQQITQLIQNKVCVIPFKVSYGIMQNVKKCEAVKTAFYKYSDEQRNIYAQKDENGKIKTELVKEGEHDTSKILFIDDEAKKKFGEAISEYLEKEIKFEPFKITDMNLIEGIDNLPPNVLLVLDKYGIIE